MVWGFNMTKKESGNISPKAVQDCRDLLLWMIPHIDKLPKNRRYTLGEKLESRIIAVLESLVTAAYAKQKTQVLSQANIDLEVSRHLWRLCYEFRAVSVDSYQHGSTLLFELGKQVGNWQRASL